MENPILYVVLNKSLKMSPGKAAAQAVHAAMMLSDTNFVDSNKRTVIVLEARDEAQIKNLAEYCQNAGLFAQYYIDEGANEVGAYSITALAVEPIEEVDKEARAIFADLDLFGFGSSIWQRIETRIHK